MKALLTNWYFIGFMALWLLAGCIFLISNAVTAIYLAVKFLRNERKNKHQGRNRMA